MQDLGMTVTDMFILANWGELADPIALSISTVSPAWLRGLFTQLGCTTAELIFPDHEWGTCPILEYLHKLNLTKQVLPILNLKA